MASRTVHEPRHTILLVQENASPRSRTYFDFESKTKAMDGVVRMFEEHLKRAFPTKSNITYDVADLFKFMDSLGDISALVLDPSSGKYEPYPRDAIKEFVYTHLRSLAQYSR